MLAAENSRNGAGKQPSVIHLWPLVKDESGVSVGPACVLAEGISQRSDLGGPAYWFDVWAFSPDGRTLAVGGAGGAGGAVRLLETASGRERARFAGHGGDIAVSVFSPDGYRLASGSRDTTVLI
jgi:WD40 repeat protein